MKVAVKYCGHCNPLIDGPIIMDNVKKKLHEVQFVDSRDDTGDVLLVISGCPVDCATRPIHIGPEITVAGPSIDDQSLDPSELPREIISKLLFYRNKLTELI